MGNRATRRSEVARFKREVAHGDLLSYLIDASEPLDHAPLLKAAARYWFDGIMSRKPYCIACKSADFADGAEVGAFLFATPTVRPSSASVSAICAACWRDLPDDAIERAALAVHRRIVPRGRFEDAP
jgi:hypothetical protein